MVECRADGYARSYITRQLVYFKMRVQVEGGITSEFPRTWNRTCTHMILLKYIPIHRIPVL